MSSADSVDGLTKGLAPGSMFTIYGISLATTTGTVTAFPLPTRFQGVRVLIGQVSPLDPLEAPILYISPGQINAVLPSNLANASGEVFVAVNGVRSVSRPFTRLSSRFSAFSAGKAGFGPATAQQVAPNGNVTLNSLLTPAQPGDAVTLWGSGLGALPAGSDADPATLFDYQGVMVSVGGIPVKPFYAGRAPGFAGLDQINFLLPYNVRSGCYVPLIVYTPYATSDTVTLSIGERNKSCTSELNLPQSAVEQLAAGGLLRVAALSFDSLTSSVDDGNRSFVTQSGEAWIGNYDVNTLSLLVTGWTPRPATPAGTLNAYNYTSVHLQGYQRGIVSLDLDPPENYRYGRPVPSPAGYLRPVANVMGGNGCTWQSADWAASPVNVVRIVPAATCLGTTFSLSSFSLSRTGLLPTARAPIPPGSFRVSISTHWVTANWNTGLAVPGDESTAILGGTFYTGGNIFGPTYSYSGVVIELGSSALSASAPAAAAVAFRQTGSIEFGSRSFSAVYEDSPDPDTPKLAVILIRNRTINGY